jgi:hypothetical protein
VDEVGDNETPEASVEYVTPFLLKKKIRKVAPPPPDDTDMEDSEVEQQLVRKASKTGAVKSSSDKVRSSDDLVDYDEKLTLFPKQIQSAAAGGRAQAAQYVDSSKVT